MSGFTITITDAGRAALVNAQNTGTQAFTLAQVGVSSTPVTGVLKGLTALPDERKRLATLAGDVVADDTLHVTIRDESAEAYAMHAFGIYTSGGVLFAVYSQPDPIIEKSSAAMLLLAVDARLVTLDTDQIVFGPVGFSLPPASQTTAGVALIATEAQADAGTDHQRIITPHLLKRALQALSGFAAIGHKHDAGDVQSGVFNVARIPSLGMEKITGLATALAGKAAAVHTHTMAQIEGLAAALAGKASANHTHHADDIAQGVLAVARIPALAMSKITGLANALAEKAPLDSADLNGAVRLPSWTAVKRRTGNQGGLLVLEKPAEGSGVNGGILLDFIGNSLLIQEQLSPWRGLNIDMTALAPGVTTQLWTTNNLNPADLDKSNRFLATQEIWNGGGGAGDYASGVLLKLSNFAPGIAFEDRSGASALNGLINLDSNILRIRADPDNDGTFSDIVAEIDLRNPTMPVGNNSRRLANTAFVQAAIDAIPATPNASTTVRGTVIMANNAQTLAGTDTTRAVSPRTLWSFPGAIGTSGYQQIPGTDLIIQWGIRSTSVGEGAVHAVLPTAFGGGCLVAMAICRNPSSDNGNDFWMQVVGKYQDRIVFLANRSGTSGSAYGYEWIAIGRAKGTPDPAYGANTGGGGSGGGGGGVFPPGDGEMPIIQP